MRVAGMPIQELDALRDFAVELAHAAGQVTLNYFRREDLAVERKADESPVTVADREAERTIRRLIETRYPDHGILGEEFEETRPGSAVRWILDPIDGTKSFIHGIPLYTVLVALEVDGEAVVGVVHNPPLGETVAAACGRGCLYNGLPCRVDPSVTELGAARLQCTDYARLQRERPQLCRALLGGVRTANTWADAYGYLLLATGRAEIMLDPEMSLWDIAALKPVIEEAGGRFTDLSGAASIHVRNSLATNGPLHDRVLELARLDAAE